MIRPRGFAARLGLATSVLIAIVCAGQSWVLGRRSLDHVRSFLVERGNSAAARLASEASPRLASNNLDALKAVAERTRAESGVVYVRVLDPQGLLLVSMGNPAAAGANEVLEFRAPIAPGPRPGGRGQRGTTPQ